jgi:hypothetical protein
VRNVERLRAAEKGSQYVELVDVDVLWVESASVHGFWNRDRESSAWCGGRFDVDCCMVLSSNRNLITLTLMWSGGAGKRAPALMNVVAATRRHSSEPAPRRGMGGGKVNWRGEEGIGNLKGASIETTHQG